MGFYRVICRLFEAGFETDGVHVIHAEPALLDIVGMDEERAIQKLQERKCVVEKID